MAVGARGQRLLPRLPDGLWDSNPTASSEARSQGELQGLGQDTKRGVLRSPCPPKPPSTVALADAAWILPPPCVPPAQPKADCRRADPTTVLLRYPRDWGIPGGCRSGVRATHPPLCGAKLGRGPKGGCGGGTEAEGGSAAQKRTGGSSHTTYTPVVPSSASERGCRERRGGGSLLHRAPLPGQSWAWGQAAAAPRGCRCGGEGGWRWPQRSRSSSPTRSSWKEESSSQDAAELSGSVVEGTLVLPRRVRVPAAPAGLSTRKERQESWLLSKTYSHLRANTMLVTNVHS